MSHQHSSCEPTDLSYQQAHQLPAPTPGDLRERRRRTAITIATIVWWTVIGITLLVLSREAAAENTSLDVQYERGQEHLEINDSYSVHVDGEAVWMYVYETLTGVAYLGLAAFSTIRLTMTRPFDPSPTAARGMTWLRGCCATFALSTALIWHPSHGGGPLISDHHLVLATAPVLVDWLFVGHREVHIRWWHPPTWSAFSLIGLHLRDHLGLGYYGPAGTISLSDSEYLFSTPTDLAIGTLLAYLLYAFVMLPRLYRQWRSQGR